MVKFKWRDSLIIILIILSSLFLFLPDINKKLVGYHDWNSVVYSASARSLLGKAETNENFYQGDYPPMLPQLLSVSFVIFGINEFSVRLIPLVFTSLTAIIIYLLSKKLLNYKIGLIASILYLNTPLIRYFAKIPVHETITPFFMLLIFYTYWLWFNEKKLKKYMMLLLSIFLAEQAGWAGYYPISLITFHYFLFSKKKKFSLVLNWWLLSLFSFTLFLFIDYLIIGRISHQGLWQIFLTRSMLGPNPGSLFTWPQFLNKEMLWLRIYLTRVITALTVIGLLILIISFFKKVKQKKENILLILIGVTGLIHVFLFRNLCWFHDYMLIYLFPFLVMFGAQGIIFVAKFLKMSYLILFIFLILVMNFESRNFLKALENNFDNYPGYELGVFVNKVTKPKEMIFIGCHEASKMYGVYFYFYANRSYAAGEPNLNDFIKEEANYKKNYRLFIVDLNHNRLPENLINYLENNYQTKLIGQFKAFDLKKT